MSLQRGIDGAEPLRPDPLGRLSGAEEIRRVVRTSELASGTFACPRCDAPVAPGPEPLAPAAGVACPYCHHWAAAREFLSLELPTRPARVSVRVVQRRR